VPRAEPRRAASGNRASRQTERAAGDSIGGGNQVPSFASGVV
jgi:hypothetical protein